MSAPTYTAEVSQTTVLPIHSFSVGAWNSIMFMHETGLQEYHPGLDRCFAIPVFPIDWLWFDPDTGRTGLLTCHPTRPIVFISIDRRYVIAVTPDGPAAEFLALAAKAFPENICAPLVRLVMQYASDWKSSDFCPSLLGKRYIEHLAASEQYLFIASSHNRQRIDANISRYNLDDMSQPPVKLEIPSGRLNECEIEHMIADRQGNVYFVLDEVIAD